MRSTYFLSVIIIPIISGALTCATLAMSARAAHAQAPDGQPPWYHGVSEDSQKRAIALTEEGLQRHREVQWQAAAEKYHAALQHWPGHPQMQFYLGRVQDKLGQPLRAYRSLEQALRFGAEGLPDAENRDMAKAIMDRLLREELAEISVSCPTPGAAVSFNGKLWFAGPGRESKLVRVGVHKVRVDKRGYYSVEQSIRPDPGERATLELQMQVDRGVYYEREFATWIPWVVLGSSAVLGAIGGGLQWQATRDFARFDEAQARLCTGEMPCASEDLSDENVVGVDQSRYAYLRTRAEREQYSALALYGLAGAAIVAGTGLLLFNRPEPRRDEYHDPHRWQIAPLASPTAVGLRAAWRF